VTCDRCGAAIAIGDFPFCPHGPMRAGRGADVTWPGGRTFENLADHPVTFYSPAEQQQYMREHRIEPYVRHIPVPGSDKSPHTTSWASGFSQEYLDGVAQMLARVGKATDPAPRTWVERFEPATETGVTRVRGVLWVE
jgi:hypothetical protein